MISCFQKLVLSYNFAFFLTCCLEQVPGPSPFATFFYQNPFPQPYFHKSNPQSNTFLNIRAVPSRAVFCSDAVLITTPSSFMQFFSLFDVLPSAPTTTGMT